LGASYKLSLVRLESLSASGEFVIVVEVLADKYLLRDVRDGRCVIKVETCRGQLRAKSREVQQSDSLGNQ